MPGTHIYKGKFLRTNPDGILENNLSYKSPHPNQYSPHPNPLPKGEGSKEENDILIKALLMNNSVIPRDEEIIKKSILIKNPNYISYEEVKNNNYEDENGENIEKKFDPKNYSLKNIQDTNISQEEAEEKIRQVYDYIIKEFKGVDMNIGDRAKIKDLLIDGYTASEIIKYMKSNNEKFGDNHKNNNKIEEKQKISSINDIFFDENGKLDESKINELFPGEENKKLRKKMIENFMYEPGNILGVECAAYARSMAGFPEGADSIYGANIEERKKYFTDEEPKVGGLIFFTGGGGYNNVYGHVAFIKEVDIENGRVLIAESNFNNDYKVNLPRWVKYNNINKNNDEVSSDWVYGFFNNTPLANTLENKN